jgi:hypothetical protein
MEYVVTPNCQKSKGLFINNQKSNARETKMTRMDGFDLTGGLIVSSDHIDLCPVFRRL